MDIRNVLNGYFEKTPVPEELDPHNASRFVVPNIAEKREARVELSEEEAAEQIRQPRTRISEPGREQPAPEAYIMPRTDKPAEPEYVPVRKSEEETGEINASSFIKIVQHNRLTGKEFLSILGNSKISNKAYQEIESNPRLTVKRLIELLEESPLSPADYEKLIIAVQRMAQLKAEAKAKIKSEPPRVTSRQETEPVSAAETSTGLSAASEARAQASAEPNIKIAPKSADVKSSISLSEKKNAGYVPSAAKYYIDPDDDSEEDDDDEEEAYDKEKEAAEQLASVKSRIQINFDDDDDEDDEDDDDDDYYYDDDDEDGKKRGSNSGKITVSAIGAVLLIGLSFGLRYRLTGSWLPSENTVIVEEVLDEGKLFEALSPLPSPSPAFTGNTAYSAGGVREDSIVKSPICGNKRLLYTENNKLYIYEQIGGQVAQLEARDYKERTLKGIIEAGDKLAAISTGTAEPYSYTCIVPSESEEGVDTAVTGTVQRNETYIELTDASSPEKTADGTMITLSGTFVTAYLQDNRLIMVTCEELPADSAAGDTATFMPYLSVDGKKSFCSAEKVFVSSPTHKGFVTVFSLNINDPADCDMAAAAGGSKPLVTKSGNELFIGQNSTLIRYSLNEGVMENGHCEIEGRISDFSGISSVSGEIRVTSLEKSPDSEEYSASLTVLDGELNTLGEIKNIGKGEDLAATCFHERETYIVTENGTCFGIDGENGVMSQSSVRITNEVVYRYSDDIGIKITAADDGVRRTGLIVSTVKLDGNLTPLYNLEISSKTVAVNALDEYISSPAEDDVSVLGGSGENGFLVVPVKYFDGVSQVERFIICTVGSDGILSVNGAVTEYDRRSDRIFAQVDGDVVIAVTKGKIITAKAQDGTVQSYYFM